MTLFTLGLACPHLGRQPGACTGTHRWLAGIALARWLEPPLPTLGLLALPALAALFLWRREPGPRLAAAGALAVQAGGVRTLWATPHFGPDDLATYNDQGQVTLMYYYVCTFQNDTTCSGLISTQDTRYGVQSLIKLTITPKVQR
jgi:hypothetical protein